MLVQPTILLAARRAPAREHLRPRRIPTFALQATAARLRPDSRYDTAADSGRASLAPVTAYSALGYTEKTPIRPAISKTLRAGSRRMTCSVPWTPTRMGPTARGPAHLPEQSDRPPWRLIRGGKARRHFATAGVP
jgi:hypothetical protein